MIATCFFLLAEPLRVSVNDPQTRSRIADTSTFLKDIRDFVPDPIQRVTFLERRLDIIDQKNVGLLAFSANYLIFFAFILTQTSYWRRGEPERWLHVADVTGTIGLVLAAIALVWSFEQLIQVKWQDYDSVEESHLKELTEVVKLRTLGLSRIRYFYMLAITCLLDYVLLYFGLAYVVLPLARA